MNRIESVELTWWDEDGGNSITLEPYQLWAIHQILGLQIIPLPQGGYEVKHFSEQTVRERVKKAGILKEAE